MKARIFVVLITVFIFLPVGYLLFREGIYRAKNGDAPIKKVTATTDTLRADSLIK